MWSQNVLALAVASHVLLPSFREKGPHEFFFRHLHARAWGVLCCSEILELSLVRPSLARSRPTMLLPNRKVRRRELYFSFCMSVRPLASRSNTYTLPDGNIPVRTVCRGEEDRNMFHVHRMHNKITTTMGHFQNIAGKVETVIVRNGARRQYNTGKSTGSFPFVGPSEPFPSFAFINFDSCKSWHCSRPFGGWELGWSSCLRTYDGSCSGGEDTADIRM